MGSFRPVVNSTIDALQLELQRLREENAALRQQLASERAKTDSAAAGSAGGYRLHAVGSPMNQLPTGGCLHPPHFRLAESGRAARWPLDLTRTLSDRWITDPHSLALNLEWVSRACVGRSRVRRLQLLHDDAARHRRIERLDAGLHGDVHAPV